MECPGEIISGKNMTSKEILQAGFLDILFEFRNKDYGAYALRRQYNYRLGKAFSIALLGVLFLVMLLSNTTGSEKLREGEVEQEVVIKTISFDPPVTPRVHLTPPHTKAPQSVKSTNITIAPQIAQADIPAVEELWADAVVSSFSQDESLLPAGAPSSENAVTAPAVQVKEVLKAVSSAPEFPGGAAAWLSFLSRQLQAPEDLETGDSKTVLVKFVVGVDGSISELVVISSGGARFDSEVIRVLRKMPKWKPALKNGTPVPTVFTQPVTFQAGEQ